MIGTDSLGYLIHHVGFVLDRQSDQVLMERLGIGFAQFKILTALRYHSALQQKTIAEYLGQTEASISRQIKNMHEKRLLTTKISERNRREHITELTEKGLRLSDEAMNILNSFHGPLFSELSEKDQQKLQELLSHLHKNICSENRPGRCHQSDVLVG